MFYSVNNNNIDFANNIISFLQETTKNNILGLFPFGSTVYQNKSAGDHDFIVITESKKVNQLTEFINNKECQFSFYTFDEFKQGVASCDIHILECLFYQNIELNDNCFFFIDSLLKDNLSLNEFKRTSISQQASNSYVKAKKKLIIVDDFDKIGSLKSLWHSLRMIDFGFQIATTGQIYDYQSCNDLYKEIESDYNLIDDYDNANDFWSFLHKKYKPIHNQYMSKLRSVTVKEVK